RNRHPKDNQRCLLYPRKRKCAVRLGMSALGQSGHSHCTSPCPLTPESGHVRCENKCLLWAKSGHRGRVRKKGRVAFPAVNQGGSSGLPRGAPAPKKRFESCSLLNWIGGEMSAL